MKCVQCQQTATVHLVTVVEGKPFDLHLCEPCANRLEADLAHPRLVQAIGTSQATAALGVGPGPRPACEICGKVPSMRVTENGRGERREHHLCESCLAERLDDREKVHHKRVAGLGQIMTEAEAKFGPLGPENVGAFGQWVCDRLRECGGGTPR